jgi:hypothetical protein
LNTTNGKTVGANDICPVGFNVPTNLDLKNEINKAGISNRSEAFSSFLKIPTAGYRNRETGGVLNPLKFIVPLVEGSGGSLTTGSLAVETLNFVLIQRMLKP